MPKLDWSALQTHDGPATGVPDLIKQLTSKNSTAREHAFEDLHRTLVGNAAWCSAAAPAVELLLEQLAKGPRPDYSAVLAADVIAADVARFWLSDDGVQAPGEVLDQLRERAPQLVKGLKSAKPVQRAISALLGMLLRDVPEFARALQLAEAKEEHSVTHAALLFALTRVGAGGEQALISDGRLSELGASGDNVVRGAAALCLLRRDAARLEALTPALHSWLDWGSGIEPGESLLFFDALAVGYFVRPLPPPIRFLLRFARLRDFSEPLSCWLREQRHAPPGRVLAAVGVGLLEVHGLLERPVGEVVRSSELSEAQRSFAAILADSACVPLAGHGLAASGITRRRWLGELPTGPLEQLIDGKPVWSWFREEYKPGQALPVPERLSASLVGADRLEAIAQRAAGAYGGAQQIKPDELERELEQIGAGAEVLARVESTADDIARRWGVAMANGEPVIREFAVHGFLLLPWLRAGRELKPEWEVLFFVGAQPQVRESMKLVPPAQRVSVLLSVLKAEYGPATQPIIDQVLGLIDLAHHVSVFSALEAKLCAVHPALRDEVASRIRAASVVAG